MSSGGLLFIGALQSENDCARNPDSSAASNRSNLIMLTGLAGQGLHPIHVLSTLPIGRYPKRGKLYVARHARKMDFARRVCLNQAAFINWGLLKPVTILVGHLFELARICYRKDFRPRWIIIHNPLLRNLPAAFLARGIWKAPVIGFITDFDNAGLRDRLRLAGARKCDAWILFSSRLRQMLPRDRPCMTIWSGLAEDIVNLERKMVNKRAARNILYTGTLREQDGLKALLEAFERIKSDDVELRITGRGPLSDEIEKRARANRRVRFYGFVPRQRYLELLSEAAVAINARLSVYEESRYNFPSKLLEYLGAGCPTISTLTGDVDGQFGRYIY
ncbi:MAG: glycosyltransferase, partial [Candidatus Omnitrophica bacterium]|nr:glycosyltransferase [Candidatus Omnitrophota bacterium]